jgi:toxin CcdB
MPRFDIYKMPGSHPGYLVDVQAPLLDHLATRAVLPLEPLAPNTIPIRDLNPIIPIGDTPHILLTQAIVAVPLRALKRPIGSLIDHQDAITRALDLLLTGF